MTRIYSNEKSHDSETENDINSINSILSGPQASPANSSPKELLHETNSNTSPPMFATMTPVNAIDLQQDLNEKKSLRNMNDNEQSKLNQNDGDSELERGIKHQEHGRVQIHIEGQEHNIEQNRSGGSNVVDVAIAGDERDVGNQEQQTINEMYLNHVKTESDILYDSEKDASNDMYTSTTATTLNQNHNGKNPQTPIDLIYEDDDNKTVIYAAVSASKNLQGIYATNEHETTMNIASGLINNTQSVVNRELNHQNHLNTTSTLSPVSNSNSKSFHTRNLDESSNIISSNSIVNVNDNSNTNGAVSLMLQGAHPSLLQYPQTHQVPGTTVLVLSELVEDISAVPVINVRKRKESLDSHHQSVVEGTIGPIIGTANPRMATELIGDPNSATLIPINSHPNDVHEHQQQTWRAIYEHPLTAATTAMLNISGAAPDDQSTAMGFIYEYCKLPTIASENTKENCNKLQDIWQTGSQSASILNAHLKNNSSVINGANLDLGNMTSNQLNHSDIQGLFINPHIGYAQTITTSNAAVAAAAAANNFNLQLIKREPEDLSHHRKLDVSSPILENNLSGIVLANKQQHHKVVLLPSNCNNETNEILVDVVSKQQQQQKQQSHGQMKDDIHSELAQSPHNPKSINNLQNNSTTSSTKHANLKQDAINVAKTMDLIGTVSTSNSVSVVNSISVSASALTSVSVTTTTPNVSTSTSPDDNIKASLYATQIFSAMNSHQNTGNGSSRGTPSPISYTNEQYNQSNYGSLTANSLRQNNSTFTLTDPYYRDYFTAVTTTNTNTSSNSSGTNATHNSDTLEPLYGSQVKQTQLSIYDSNEMGGNPSGSSTPSFVDRYVRQSSLYHNKGVIAAATAAGLTVDLPSPDSGIGTDAITPRDQNTIQQSFDYAELCQNNSSLLEHANLSSNSSQSQRSNSSTQNSSPASSRSRPWHDFGRQSDSDKIQIPKLYIPYGFKYHLEAPISTSQRIEEDRITYINKGQFYGILLDYISDPDKQLKSQTVKSVIMLMFREEKSPEDEIKAWQFWHGRQHSVKQRILDADTKNSIGIVGCIEEIAHNAIAVYWNPLESGAKISVAIQCLSTDFSSQKGVKGLPLHLQIDTYEDPREPVVSHRGYCQIKVFCDKGAERKTRDEERRAARRKSIVPKCKKIDEYHLPNEKSEFYSMSDLTKPPVLFAPAEDFEKLTSMDLQGFYSNDNENTINNDGSNLKSNSSSSSSSPFLFNSMLLKGSATTQTFKFHNHFPPDNNNTSTTTTATLSIDSKDNILNNLNGSNNTVYSPALKKPKFMNSNCSNHSSSPNVPPLSERVMLYVRQESDDAYTPIHVVPPTTVGLINATFGKN